MDTEDLDWLDWRAKDPSELHLSLGILHSYCSQSDAVGRIARLSSGGGLDCALRARRTDSAYCIGVAAAQTTRVVCWRCSCVPRTHAIKVRCVSTLLRSCVCECAAVVASNELASQHSLITDTRQIIGFGACELLGQLLSAKMRLDREIVLGRQIRQKLTLPNY